MHRRKIFLNWCNDMTVKSSNYKKKKADPPGKGKKDKNPGKKKGRK